MKPFALQDMAPPDGPRLLLSIAGLNVAIACNDSALFDRLRQRYTLFTVRETAPPLCVVYAHMDAAHAAHRLLAPGEGVHFYHNTRCFTSAGCDGTIDIESGAAWLHLSPRQPVADVDYCLRVVYALLAFRSGGLLFHAAGVVRDGQAFLFFGHSGSGKTTIARHSPDGSILNDDLVLLMPDVGGWLVYATPFWNPSQVGPSGPRSAPLTMLLRLVQAKQVVLEEMSQGQALAELVSCVPIVATDTPHSQDLLARSLHILQRVPVYRLHFLPDATFWQAVETLVQ